jgi:hypothetical protein
MRALKLDFAVFEGSSAGAIGFQAFYEFLDLYLLNFSSYLFADT